ncbi:hypothetical protein IH970_03990 [candidate division KSB1 bacterium]|nr:hypothetical protein [candidate division KSB1 bacterium]
MAQFILLLRGVNEQLNHYSPEELQKLKDDVRHRVTVKNGEIVDGPFTETKETIGGYFVVETNELQEAVEIARKCPILSHGGSVEIQEIHLGACRQSS